MSNIYVGYKRILFRDRIQYISTSTSHPNALEQEQKVEICTQPFSRHLAGRTGSQVSSTLQAQNWVNNFFYSIQCQPPQLPVWTVVLMVGTKSVKSAAEIVWMHGKFPIIGLHYCEMFHVIIVNSTTLYFCLL